MDLGQRLPTLLHGRELTRIPNLAMTFFNDTLYVAGSMAALPSKRACGGVVGRTGRFTTLASRVEMLRTTAFAHAHAQVREHAVSLQEGIGGLGLFRRTHYPANARRARDAMREVASRLERLACVWKPLLSPVYFARFLGAILDNVGTCVYAEIMGLGNISVQETEALPAVIAELVGGGLARMLERRSPGQPPPRLKSKGHGQGGERGERGERGEGGEGGDPTAALLAHYCRHAWSKLEALVGLFAMPLRDIVQGRDGLAARGISPDEVAHFVTMVFEESPLREESIATILGGAMA